MGKRLSVREAAQKMNVSEQFVRVGLQRGIFSWGYAVKMSSKWTYFINAVKFHEIEQGKRKSTKGSTISKWCS